MSLALVRTGPPAAQIFHALEDPTQMATIASLFVSTIVIVIAMRGGMGLIRDLHRLLSYFLRKKYVDKEVQIEPYFPQLPETIFFKKKSDVYHTLGCHHIGLRAEPRSACCLCRNVF